MASPTEPNTQRVEVEYPAEILDEMSSEQVQRLAREALMARLYQAGHSLVGTRWCVPWHLALGLSRPPWPI